LTTNQSETDSTAEAAKPKFQFQLRHVFYATTYYAGQPDQRTKRVSRLALSVPFGCCLVGLTASLFSTAHHPAAKRTWCSNNIRQLQLAMLNYESSHLKFPRATELDAQGQPMHSWRVRILPYVGPSNLKLLDEMPECFRCPYRKETNRTPYKLVVGPGTLFDGGERSFERIVDGTSNTIAIVEDGANPVEWTRPSDLSIDEAIAALAPVDFKNLPHVTESAFETTYAPGFVGFFDGSIEYSGLLNPDDLPADMGIPS